MILCDSMRKNSRPFINVRHLLSGNSWPGSHWSMWVLKDEWLLGSKMCKGISKKMTSGDAIRSENKKSIYQNTRNNKSRAPKQQNIVLTSHKTVKTRTYQPSFWISVCVSAWMSEPSKLFWYKSSWIKTHEEPESLNTIETTTLIKAVSIVNVLSKCNVKSIFDLF